MVNTRNRSQSADRQLNFIETPYNPINMKMKLPVFTQDNPDLYFKIIESIQFNYKPNESELFLNLFVSLPNAIQALSKHLLESGAKNQISELKKIINTQYKLPIEDRIKKLILSTKMGDLTPSQYLQYIQDILGDDAVKHESLIRNQFLASLPSSIAPFIDLFSKDCDLRSIALAADKAPAYSNKTINEIQPKPAHVESRMDTLEAQINNLNRQENFEISNFKRDIEAQLSNLMQQIYMTQSTLRDLQSSFDSESRQGSRYNQNRYPSNNRFSSHNRFNSRNRSQNRGNSSFSRNNNHGQCYYHFKFKQNAKRCVAPCSYNQSQNTENNTNSGNGL